MNKPNKVRRPDTGCYGDGSLGHDHTRIRCAMLLESYAWAEADVGNSERAKLMSETARELRSEMSDDASEETQAIRWLKEVAYRPDAFWGWQDGDFGLWPLEDSEDDYPMSDPAAHPDWSK